jgi:hypothetical protein
LSEGEAVSSVQGEAVAAVKEPTWQVGVELQFKTGDTAKVAQVEERFLALAKANQGWLFEGVEFLTLTPTWRYPRVRGWS